MYNADKPPASELPSTAKLLKSTLAAAIIASVLTVTVVLPAEYGIDPTRVGSMFGLTEMGRIKRQLAAEAEAEPVGAAPPGAAVGAAPLNRPVTADRRSDETVVTLAPDEGAEIKLAMEEGAIADFVWASDGGKVNYDTHADRPGIRYHGYDKGSSDRIKGRLVAAFDGSHGWFWRNRTGEPVRITLKTEGAYTEIKRVE